MKRPPITTNDGKPRIVPVDPDMSLPPGRASRGDRELALRLAEELARNTAKQSEEETHDSFDPPMRR